MELSLPGAKVRWFFFCVLSTVVFLSACLFIFAAYFLQEINSLILLAKRLHACECISILLAAVLLSVG